MKPGTVVIDGKRAFVVLEVRGSLKLTSPIRPAAGPRYAGDVALEGNLVVRNAEAAISTCADYDQSPWPVPEALVAECRKWVDRCTATARIIAKAAPLASWHREAANERSVVG